jgi:hypothetical protein
MEEAVPQGLSVLQLPAALRRRLRTTNLNERLNKEIVGGGQKESQNGGHGRAGSCEMASRSQGDAPVCEAAFRSTYDVDAERLARAAR